MNGLSTRQFRKEDAERLLDFISSCSTKPFVEMFEDFVMKRDKHLEERGLMEVKTLLVSFLDESLGKAMNLEKYKEIIMRKSLDSIPKEPTVYFRRFRVIEATHGDVNRICKAINRMRTTRMETIFQPDWIKERMKHSACLIAEVNGKIVGAVWLDRSTAEICDIRVHPEYRAQGIGEALMFHALKYSKRQKQKEVRLSVSPQNKIAFNWYLRLGFEILGDNPIPERYIIYL